MIIDNTYFDYGTKYVPNNKDISVKPVGAPTVQSELDSFIENSERQLLLEALGVTLYNELKSHLAPEGTYESVINTDPVQVVATEGQTKITLSYIPKSLIIHINREYQIPNNDYTFLAKEITFNTPLMAGEIIDIVGSTTQQFADQNLLIIDVSAPQKWKDLVNGKDYTIDGITYRWDGLKGYNKESLIAFYVFCEYLRSDLFTYTTTGVIKNVANNAIDAGFDIIHRLSWSSFLEKYQKKERCVLSSLYQYLCDMNVLDPTTFPDFDFKFYGSRNEFGI